MRWGLLIAVAAGAAGCSDTSRFTDTFGGPYGSQPANQMAATPMPPPPSGGVERQALPPAEYGRAPDTTGAAASGHWDWEGGTAVIVGAGETIEGIARRHRVPARAIIEANGITNPAAIMPGQRLVIPRYVPGGPGAKVAHAATPRTLAPQVPAPNQPHMAAPEVKTSTPHPALPHVAVSAPHAASSAPDPSLPSSAPSGSGQTLLPAAPVHTVASGDTLSRIAHKYRVKVKDLAVANGMVPETPLKVGQKIAVPIKAVAAPPKGQQAAGVAPPAAAKPPVGAQAKAPSAPAGKITVAEQGSKVQVVQPADPPADEIAAANGVPAFRWPARGRVIANFGAKVNGAASDGIDLAVPEGTPVRASDDGVVAYSGSELKGYGNLVLVRHANGFVTAYAHASELLVKRNDQVRKGQVIAKSGQTGTASSPQLHFEIRKNSAPVDPIQFLPSDKTASAPL
jgi:murein DD-endopeptidase MepM/ murein hydrolase activator NlpD